MHLKTFSKLAGAFEAGGCDYVFDSDFTKALPPYAPTSSPKFV